MATNVRIKETLPELTDKIVQTYSDLDTITHLGHCPLPSYESIVEILESLKDIIFPGYRRRDGLHLGNITYHVGDLIDRLHDQLTEQTAPGPASRAGRGVHLRPAAEGRLRGPRAGQGGGFLTGDFGGPRVAGHQRPRRPTTATRPASRWTR